MVKLHKFSFLFLCNLSIDLSYYINYYFINYITNFSTQLHYFRCMVIDIYNSPFSRGSLDRKVEVCIEVIFIKFFLIGKVSLYHLTIFIISITYGVIGFMVS